MEQMTNLTEEDLDSISKTLGISKESLRSMTEEELLLEFETALQKLKLEVASKREENRFFRIDNFKLRIANAFLRFGCFLQQIRIGVELTIKDLEYFLRIK